MGQTVKSSWRSLPGFRVGAGMGFSGIGIALLLVTAMVLGSQELRRRPGFCATCHHTAYKEWQRSGTAVNHQVCIECHAGAGVVEAVVAVVKGGFRKAPFITGVDPITAKAEVPNSNCVTCHKHKAKITAGHHRSIPAQARLDFCSRCHGGNDDGQEAVLSGRLRPCSSCHNHTQGGSFLHGTEAHRMRE